MKVCIVGASGKLGRYGAHYPSCLVGGLAVVFGTGALHGHGRWHLNFRRICTRRKSPLIRSMVQKALLAGHEVVAIDSGEARSRCTQ